MNHRSITFFLLIPLYFYRNHPSILIKEKNGGKWILILKAQVKIVGKKKTLFFFSKG